MTGSALPDRVRGHSVCVSLMSTLFTKDDINTHKGHLLRGPPVIFPSHTPHSLLQILSGSKSINVTKGK